MTKAHELYRVLDVASRLYHQALIKPVHSGAHAARSYLAERRVFGPVIDLFRMGYSPSPSWIVDRLHEVDRGVLVEAGLLVEGRDGLVDPMAGRIVFPQTSPAGQVVGFVGRAFDPAVSEGYKYVSTPQTSVYRRSEILYRIDLARRSVISEGRALVVEGPLDAVLLWQIGQQNVVATGTARMTDAQAQILARYTQRLDVMFDSDDSGREAFDRLRRERGGLFLSVDRKLVPPPFKDPADWVRAQIDRRIAAG